MQVKRVIATGLVAAVLLGAVAQAKVYKWVDENGKVVFSQTPPPDSIQAEEVKVDAPPPASAPKPADKAQAAEPVSKEVKGNPALDDGLRKEYCEKGRQNLKVLEEAGPKMGFVTEDGDLVRFSPEEKALKIKEAKAIVKAYCD